MARFYGQVGFVHDVAGAADTIIEEPTEKYYKGDLISSNRRLEDSTELNDNIKVNNQISIIADAYAYSNIFAMRYVKWMGAAWKVTNVDVKHPRLILTLGGEYNGKTAG